MDDALALPDAAPSSLAEALEFAAHPPHILTSRSLTLSALHSGACTSCDRRCAACCACSRRPGPRSKESRTDATISGSVGRFHVAESVIFEAELEVSRLGALPDRLIKGSSSHQRSDLRLALMLLSSHPHPHTRSLACTCRHHTPCRGRTHVRHRCRRCRALATAAAARAAAIRAAVGPRLRRPCSR